MFTVSTKKGIATKVYVPFAIGHVHTRSDENVFTLNVNISSDALILELCTIDTAGHIEMLTSCFLEGIEITIQSIQV